MPEIAVLNGPFPGTAAEFVAHDLIPVLNHPGQIEEWARLDFPADRHPPSPASGEGQEAVPAVRKHGGPSGDQPPAILHVDTGMARLGLTPREFAAFVEDRPPIAWRAVISHLACADDPEHPLNARQRARFAAVAARFPGVPASLAASSGIFLGAPHHFDLVRPGAALYGVNPLSGPPQPAAPGRAAHRKNYPDARN